MPQLPVELIIGVAVAGAVLGVLGVLGTLLAIVAKLDARYITRAEAVVQLAALAAGQARIEAALTRHVEREGGG